MIFLKTVFEQSVCSVFFSFYFLWKSMKHCLNDNSRFSIARDSQEKTEVALLKEERRKAEKRDYSPWEISRHYLCEFYPDSF